MSATQSKNPLIFPDSMPLYPTAGSLEEVVSLGESQLPIMDKNKLFILLMIMHNTSIKLNQQEERRNDR
jgi:hypothetical protein